MRAQISLEYLYINSIAIIITLFLIGVLISYYSSSFSLPDRCITPYFLNCEGMFMNSSGIVLNLRNNFNYDVIVTKIILNGTDYNFNIRLNRTKNSTLTIPINIPKNTNYFGQLEIYYRPVQISDEFVLYGRVNGRVRE